MEHLKLIQAQETFTTWQVQNTVEMTKLVALGLRVNRSKRVAPGSPVQNYFSENRRSLGDILR